MNEIEAVKLEIKQAELQLENKRKLMEKASIYRMMLPIGSSRARVTTANARLNTYCEAVSRCEKHIADLRNKLIMLGS